MVSNFRGVNSIRCVVMVCGLRTGGVLQSLWRRDLFMRSVERVPRCYVKIKKCLRSVAEWQTHVTSDTDAPRECLREEVNCTVHRKLKRPTGHDGKRNINGRAGLDGISSVYCQMYYVHFEFLGLEA